jgi:hypothetical protein
MAQCCPIQLLQRGVVHSHSRRVSGSPRRVSSTAVAPPGPSKQGGRSTTRRPALWRVRRTVSCRAVPCHTRMRPPCALHSDGPGCGAAGGLAAPGLYDCPGARIGRAGRVDGPLRSATRSPRSGGASRGTAQPPFDGVVKVAAHRCFTGVSAEQFGCVSDSCPCVGRARAGDGAWANEEKARDGCSADASHDIQETWLGCSDGGSQEWVSCTAGWLCACAETSCFR